MKDEPFIITAQQLSRFEVIDHRKDANPSGRVMSLKGVNVELSYQDDGTTLKVFIT